ncbi:MAG: response regulator transcription factor [Gemmatimonadetes bacterium]|nr:response regulator transcription factor [Gemmatimonadota bacterium]
MSEPISIVIADDHPLFRKGLEDILHTDPTVRIVGQAVNGEEALELIERHRPRLAILDVEMPRKGGLEVAAAVLERGLMVDIVLLTMHAARDLLDRALELGVKGYVVKESAVDDILACINVVAAGRTYVSGALSHHLVGRRESARKSVQALPGLDTLTPGERQVLELIAQSGTTREIAAKLGVSPKTVENHRSNICLKLNLHGANSLLRFALEHKSLLT